MNYEDVYEEMFCCEIFIQTNYLITWAHNNQLSSSLNLSSWFKHIQVSTFQQITLKCLVEHEQPKLIRREDVPIDL